MNEVYDDTELREMCADDGDWGGTPWGAAILDLLTRIDAATGGAALWCITCREEATDVCVEDHPLTIKGPLETEAAP